MFGINLVFKFCNLCGFGLLLFNIGEVLGFIVIILMLGYFFFRILFILDNVLLVLILVRNVLIVFFLNCCNNLGFVVNL